MEKLNDYTDMYWIIVGIGSIALGWIVYLDWRDKTNQ